MQRYGRYFNYDVADVAMWQLPPYLIACLNNEQRDLFQVFD